MNLFDKEEKKSNNKPKFKLTGEHGITLTVWENEKQDQSGNKYLERSYALERSYKTPDGDWKKTSSLKKKHLPSAIALLTKAYGEETIHTEEF